VRRCQQQQEQQQPPQEQTSQSERYASPTRRVQVAPVDETGTDRPAVANKKKSKKREEQELAGISSAAKTRN